MVIVHVYREANACADRLAKYGYSIPVGLIMFDKLPPCTSTSGRLVLRTVHCNSK